MAVSQGLASIKGGRGLPGNTAMTLATLEVRIKEQVGTLVIENGQNSFKAVDTVSNCCISVSENSEGVKVVMTKTHATPFMTSYSRMTTASSPMQILIPDDTWYEMFEVTDAGRLRDGTQMVAYNSWWGGRELDHMVILIVAVFRMAAEGYVTG